MLKTAASVMTAATSSPRSVHQPTKLSGSFQVSTIERVGSSSAGTPGPAATGAGRAGRPGQCRVHVVAPVNGVLPAVVVPLEADDQPPPGVRARQPHRRADGLAAGVGEPHLLDAGHRVDHLLGRLDLELVGQPEAGAQIGDRARRPPAVTAGCRWPRIIRPARPARQGGYGSIPPGGHADLDPGRELDADHGDHQHDQAGGAADGDVRGGVRGGGAEHREKGPSSRTSATVPMM